MVNLFIIILLTILLIITFLNQRKLLRKYENVETKLKNFDDHLLTSLKDLEKKIYSSGNDVEKVRKDFRTFQAKFMVFDKKVEKITECMI